MLNVSDPSHPFQTGIVNLGENGGPHAIALTDDDRHLVVSDYFLNEDNFGKIHFEGDHKVHVIRVFRIIWNWTRVLRWISTQHLQPDPRVRTDWP